MDSPNYLGRIVSILSMLWFRRPLGTGGAVRFSEAVLCSFSAGEVALGALTGFFNPRL
jgi:hypothetical protein